MMLSPYPPKDDIDKHVPNFPNTVGITVWVHIDFCNLDTQNIVFTSNEIQRHLKSEKKFIMFCYTDGWECQINGKLCLLKWQLVLELIRHEFISSRVEHSSKHSCSAVTFKSSHLLIYPTVPNENKIEGTK